MSAPSEAQVRAIVLTHLAQPLQVAGIAPDAVGDDLDLFASGVIDSLGLLEMIAAVEEEYGLEIDFETLDPAELTVLGPFCRFIAAEGRRAGRAA